MNRWLSGIKHKMKSKDIEWHLTSLQETKIMLGRRFKHMQEGFCKDCF